MKGFMKANKQDYYDKMGLSKEDVKMLNTYFAAFANLYGKVSLRSAFEIINEQNDNRFSEDVLLKFAKSKNREKRFFFVEGPKDFYDDVVSSDPLDDEIIHEAVLVVDEEDYYILDEAQKDKPLCVLPKEELLKYAEDFYYEETPEVKALEEYLKKNATIVQPPVSTGCVNTARDLVEEYVLDVHLDIELDSTNIDALLRLVEPPEDEKEEVEFLRKLLPLAMEVHNNTRMWVNRGYTPKELGILMGRPSPEDIRAFAEYM